MRYRWDVLFVSAHDKPVVVCHMVQFMQSHALTRALYAVRWFAVSTDTGTPLGANPKTGSAGSLRVPNSVRAAMLDILLNGSLASRYGDNATWLSQKLLESDTIYIRTTQS